MAECRRYTGLGPGNYNVQMRDAANNSCIKVLNNAYSIIQLPAVSALVTPAMVTCDGAMSEKLVYNGSGRRIPEIMSIQLMAAPYGRVQACTQDWHPGFMM